MIGIRFTVAQRIGRSSTPPIGPRPTPSQQALEAWKTEAPKRALWAEDNLPEGFAAFDFPDAQRIRLRTAMASNGSTGRSNGAPVWRLSSKHRILSARVSALLAKCDENG